MWKILSPPLAKRVWEVVFLPVPEVVYFSFNILFDIFWDYIFDLYIKIWRRGFGLRLSFYLSKRASLCSRYGVFYYTFTYFVPIRLIEGGVTKINCKCFNGKLWPFPLSWLINFLYSPAHNAWLRLSSRSGGNTDCFWYRLPLLGT